MLLGQKGEPQAQALGYSVGAEVQQCMSKRQVLDKLMNFVLTGGERHEVLAFPGSGLLRGDGR